MLTLSPLPQIMDVDEEWAQQIRMRKFEIYNEEWMQAIEEDAQLEAYYDGGGDEADLEARIGESCWPCCRPYQSLSWSVVVIFGCRWRMVVHRHAAA